MKLIGQALDSDVIIEPVRAPLIPGMSAVKEAAKAAGACGGALWCAVTHPFSQRSVPARLHSTAWPRGGAQLDRHQGTFVWVDGKKGCKEGVIQHTSARTARACHIPPLSPCPSPSNIHPHPPTYTRSHPMLPLAGAYGCTISGAGPTAVAIVDDPEVGRRVAEAIAKAFKQAGNLDVNSAKVVGLDPIGAKFA